MMNIYYKILSLTMLTIFQSSGIFLVLFSVCQKNYISNLEVYLAKKDLFKILEPNISESVVL